MSLMARLVPVTGADLVSSNVSSTADDYSATEPYVTDEEVNYGDRVYVALAGTTFPVGQSSIQTATPGDAIWHGGQLEIGDTVAFTSSNTLPTGISANTLYYVKESDTPSLPFSTWFSVSTTQGGSSVNITATGTGTLTVHRNPVFGVTPGTDDTKWLDSRPTNEWAMFDEFTLTKTSNASSIAVTVTPGSRFDVVGLLGLANVSWATIAAYTSGGTGETFQRTEEFDNAYWTKTQATVTANAATAPNGTATADKLVEAATTNIHALSRDAGTVGVAECLSVWLKAAERSWAILQIGSNGNAWFNLSTGATGTVLNCTAAIEDFGNGWYRCSVTATRNATQVNAIFTSTGNGVSSYAGDGSSGIYVWGANLKTGTTPGDYVEVTGTAQKAYHHFAGYDLTETAFADDWYAGTYAEAVYKDRLAVSTIDPLASATAYIYLTGSGTIECGSCLFGLSKDIGLAQYGAQTGIDNYTRIERDDFGGIQIDATRGYSDNAEYEVWFTRAKSGALRKLFADHKDAPVLMLMAPHDDEPGGWEATGIHHGLVTLRTTLSYPSHYVGRIEIEGCT